MWTIHKYPIRIETEFSLEIPGFPQFLHAGTQDGDPFFWALVADEAPKKTYTFRIVGTGHPIDDPFTLQHVGTFLRGQFVWHLFLKKE